MEERKKSRKRLTSFGKLLVCTAIGFVAFSICVGSAVWYLARNYSGNQSQLVTMKKTVPVSTLLPASAPLQPLHPEIKHPELAEFIDASSEKKGRWYGLCKKQSVQSIEDFRQTVENDPALSIYYAGFNWEEAKIGSLKDDVMAYVSHRKGDSIGPTTKPIKLPKGDQYITDGKRTARTYCCNDIDLSPSAGNDPGPVMDPATYTLPAPPAPPVPQSSWTQSPLDLPGIPDPVPPHVQVAPVPEPGTIVLMGAGLLALAGIGRRTRTGKQGRDLHP